MHWLDVLAVQGTLKSLLRHHSSKASISTPGITVILFLNCISTFPLKMTHVVNFIFCHKKKKIGEKRSSQRSPPPPPQSIPIFCNVCLFYPNSFLTHFMDAEMKLLRGH
ncbi:hypothetical protein R6Z07F_018958 [Ovis aries]